MSEYVWSDIGKRCVLEQLLPESRKPDERLSFSRSLENIAFIVVGEERIKEVQDRQSHWANRRSFLAIL
jgi:hypothetical protein